jgi:hypothetical protein
MARMLGHGNLGKVAAAAGMSRNTIVAGIADLDNGVLPPGRVRLREPVASSWSSPSPVSCTRLTA